VAAARRHVRLDADDGLDPALNGRAVEFDGTEHVAVIRHRHGRHAQGFDTLHELADLVRAVEKAVLRVKVQVDKTHSPRLTRAAPTPRPARARS